MPRPSRRAIPKDTGESCVSTKAIARRGGTIDHSSHQGMIEADALVVIADNPGSGGRLQIVQRGSLSVTQFLCRRDDLSETRVRVGRCHIQDHSCRGGKTGDPFYECLLESIGHWEFVGEAESSGCLRANRPRKFHKGKRVSGGNREDPTAKFGLEICRDQFEQSSRGLLVQGLKAKLRQGVATKGRVESITNGHEEKRTL